VAGEAFALVYASPLRRAHETAEIVAARLGLELRLHADLKEVDVGSWSGLTRDEVAQRHPDDFARWLAHGHGWADGESYEQLAERVVGGLVDLASAHAGERLLAVTHGGPIRAAMAGARGVSFAEARRSIRIVENCGLVQVAVRAGRLTPVA
jgi:probable phosphoglycerate mutase